MLGFLTPILCKCGSRLVARGEGKHFRRLKARGHHELVPFSDELQ